MAKRCCRIYDFLIIDATASDFVSLSQFLQGVADISLRNFHGVMAVKTGAA